MMTPQEKYLATARLGEGVTYTIGPEKWTGASIVAQHSDTVVDLFVMDKFAQTTYFKLGVQFDLMAEKPNTWSKTRT